MVKIGYRRMSLFNFHPRNTDEGLTPPLLLAPLGIFDLDPCAPTIRPWDTAKNHYTKRDNGLLKPWTGRVWCNPPYGNDVRPWLLRCAEHGNCISLLFARTETAAFFDYVWKRADALLFLRGRVFFYRPNGKRGIRSNEPSVLVAYGRENALKLKTSGMDGQYIEFKRSNRGKV